MEKKPPSAPSPPSTTFLQADAATFKELVQRLTGHHEPQQRCSPPPPPLPNSPTVDAAAARLSGLKRLHERRRGGCSRLKLTVHKPAAACTAPKQAIPAAAPPPASRFARLDVSESEEEGGHKEVIIVDEEEEEQAIKERRFYLHPSPRSGMRMPQPDLLPLFPLTSPKAGEQ